MLFADVKSSMDLAGQLDAEDWHRILDRFFTILSDGVHRYEGTVNQYTGDGIMALFGAPIAHEDHAQRACYAALRMRAELQRFSLDLRMELGLDFGVRIGINSGEVVVGKIGDDLRMDYTAQGQTVGLAQRMEQIAESGQAYISEHSARLVRGYFKLSDLGASKLVGSAEKVGVFKLDDTTAAHTRLQVSRARGLTEFFGRSDEMEILGKALQRAKDGHGQVVGVVGEPGLGKSRLCYEFTEQCRSEGIAVDECHCPSYGKSIPFIPILELFRAYFDISERDDPVQARQKIAGALVLLDPTLQAALPTLFEFLGVQDAHRPAPRIEAEMRQRQLFELLHKITRAQNERGLSTVILVDDLHWIDTWSDEFIAQLVDAIENSYSVLLVNFRPEYRALWTAKSHYQQLPLVPLGADALREMVTSLLGEDPSVVALTKRIMEWTAGNPLYSEEVINTLIETGQLEGRRGAFRLTREVAALEVPATVQAIIAGRIDRLDDDEKSLLHAASVVGKEFSRPLIERISSLAAADLTPILERLKAADFVYEIALYPTVEYSFKHPLVHEVAYETQLRAKRATQHATVALALEALEAERIDEFCSMIAYHWERANEIDEALRWHERAAEVSGLNDPRASLAHWQKVITFADQLEPDIEVLSAGARACNAAMTIQWRLGATEDQARETFEAGTALAERAGNTGLQAALTGSYAGLRGITLGYANEFVKFADDAIRLADRTADDELKHAMRNWRGFGLLFSGRFSEMVANGTALLECLPDNLIYGEAYIAPNLSWSARACLGWGFGHLGNIARHRDVLDDAVRFSNGLAEIEAYACTARSYVSVLFGETTVALNYAQNSMLAAEASGTSLAQINACLAMAATQAHLGEFASAADVACRGLAIAENEQSGGAFISGIVGALAEAEIGLGNLQRGREHAEHIIAYCHVRHLYMFLTPWLALARACIALGERDAALVALDDTQTLIEQTGSLIMQPHLHECRAKFARTFEAGWSADEKLKEGHRLFAELGATGQAERLAQLF